MDPDHHLLSIFTDSPLPIYRQLMDQIRRLIAAGVLVPDETLPSVRQVARTLAVDPMTVSKAYNLLAMDGVLERIRGQGMRVRLGYIDRNAQREALLLPSLKQAAREARQLELDDHTSLELFKKVLNEER